MNGGRPRPGRLRRRLVRLAVAVALVLGATTVVGLVSPGTLIAAGRWMTLLSARADHGVVTVDGVRLAWSAVGEGRPIVLQHGLGGEGTALMPLAKAFAAQGYRAFMIDLPGAGRSPRPEVPIDLDEAGRLALRAAREAGAGERPPLVGHSLGGWIVAWQALERPQEVGPVVLLCSAGLHFEPPPLNELMPRSVADGRRNLKRLFATPPYIPYPIMWLAVHRPRHANFALLRSAMSGRYLLDGLLEGMSVPALVISARHDGVVPVEAGRAMARQIPGARYVEFEDASHMIVWERPEAVVDEVDRFLRSLPPARAERAAAD